ncbi:lipoprotein [Rhodanobacter sp. C03]|uniref:LPS translocon maturation chaperone LptM n=1 Tax=Rhodanobacter sp. C03 TaxID=1945858 RepID=UPI000984F909|nr:lipoprotein [Rhodanobacter sp. C03]OOG57969.1 sugar transporter [Rhodanobacter sp. C03]
MRRSLLLLSLCLVVAMLTGCGQKGPLVLPPTKPATASSTAKPHTPAPAASSATPASDQY